MKLKPITRNALWSMLEEEDACDPPETKEAWEHGPPKDVVSKFSYERISNQYSIGKLGLKEIEAWLAEDGFKLRYMSTPKSKTSPNKIQWISIGDKTPPVGENVLVTNTNSTFKAIWTDAVYFGCEPRQDKDLLYWKSGNDMNDASHWAVMPNMPNKE
jgi:hypothetical protein